MKAVIGTAGVKQSLETRLLSTSIMVRQLLELAPGFSCWGGGEEEALFIYKEIFEDDTYNVTPLPENAFVVDVGANIGLFLSLIHI